MLDQRLRHRRVDIIMRHVIADAKGAPAESKFGQIARSDHQAASLIGETKQIVGTQSCLYVLERHVVNWLALGERMTHIREHLLGRRPDVDLLAGRAERMNE